MSRESDTCAVWFCCVCKFPSLCIPPRFVARLDLIAKAYNLPFTPSCSDAAPVSALCPIARRYSGRLPPESECRCTWPLTRFDSSRPGLCYAQRQPRSLILDPQGRDFIHKSGDEGSWHASLSLSFSFPLPLSLPHRSRRVYTSTFARFLRSYRNDVAVKFSSFVRTSRRCRCHSLKHSALLTRNFITRCSISILLPKSTRAKPSPVVLVLRATECTYAHRSLALFRAKRTMQTSHGKFSGIQLGPSLICQNNYRFWLEV